MSRRTERKHYKQEQRFNSNVFSTVLGLLGYLSITSKRVGNYHGGLAPVGEGITLETGNKASVQLGDGHTVNLINTTQGDFTYYPEGIKEVLDDQCPELPIPEVDVDISDASALLLGKKLYGDDKLEIGFAGMTEETKKNDVIIDKNVFVAEGGFESLQRIFGESYPLRGGFWAGKNVSVSPLEDVNGTLVHELNGHVCKDLGEEGSFQLQRDYLATEGAPLLIKPDALKPDYLYADALMTGMGIFLLAQVTLRRVFGRRKF